MDIDNIAQLIRMVLDALGLDLFYVPLPVWDVKRCGSKRSLVRRVGSQLPLGPARRPRVQNELLGAASEIGSDVTNVCPTLSDLRWIYDDTGDGTVLSRLHSHASTETQREHVTTVSRVVAKALKPVVSRPCTPVDQPIPPQPQCQPTPDVAAMEKISVLEDELVKLRQQIAMIVMLQEQAKTVQPAVAAIDVPPTPPSTPGGPPGAPVSRGAPLVPPVPGGPPAPPPPPGCPPPPPPPPPVMAPKKSVIDSIKERKKNNSNQPQKSTTPGVPNMADVLKGLGTVKLRSIERSPGGTPMRQKPRETSGTDPASLIAQALKKKFAHRHLHSPNDDGDKENRGYRDFTPSPKKACSATTPEFGQHKLKATGRRLSNITEPRRAASPLKVIN